MTDAQFAALEVGQVVYLISRPIVNDMPNSPAQMIRERVVTKIDRRSEGRYFDSIAVGKPVLWFSPIECYASFREAQEEAIARVDSFRAGLNTLRAAIVSAREPIVDKEGGQS